jgi:hypothetical protein
MKKLSISLMMLIFITSLKVYSQTIYYNYDNAGNRIGRTIYLEDNKGSASHTNKDIKDSFIDDTFKPQSIKIYPNPTRELLSIEVPEDPENNTEIQIILTDTNGKVILNKTKVSHITEVNLSTQPDGLYILTLKKGIATSKWKIIKQ